MWRAHSTGSPPERTGALPERISPLLEGYRCSRRASEGVAGRERVLGGEGGRQPLVHVLLDSTELLVDRVRRLVRLGHGAQLREAASSVVERIARDVRAVSYTH